jgi:hypothetical protein
MSRLTTFLIFLFVSLSVAAQTSDSTAIAILQQQVDKLETELKKQKKGVSKQIESLRTEVVQCRDEARFISENVAIIADSLGVKINETATTTESKITDISENVNKKSLFGIIGGVILLLLSIGLFVYLLLKRKADSASIIKQLEEQKSAIETKLVKEYSQQAEVLENLLKTIREIPISTNGGEPDHSLALKLADEITLMERNLSLMDSSTKGLKQLNRSIGKLKDNLAVNGYEIPELLGKPYNEGFKVIVINSIYDESLKEGEKIISKIIKPQVNYQDKMIHAAQIELNAG